MHISSLVIVFLLLVVALVCGWSLGGRNRIRYVRRAMLSRLSANTMGKLLRSEEERRSAARIYLDPVAAAQNMASYDWDVAVAPAPFLGGVPASWLNADRPSTAPLLPPEAAVQGPKPPGAHRVFLTGGSVAFGSSAPGPEGTIGGFLAARLAGESVGLCEVRVAACPAWSSTHERISVENILSEQEPDLVVSVSGNNDAHWAWNSRHILWHRFYAENGFFNVLDEAYHAVGLPGPADTVAALPCPPSVEEAARLLVKNVHLAHTALALAGCPYIFCLQPTLPVTGKQLTAREKGWLGRWHPAQIDYFRSFYALTRARLTALSGMLEGFGFVDLSGLFDEVGEDEDIFLDSYHFGDKGHLRIADALLPHVLSTLKPRRLSGASTPEGR